MAFSVAKQSTGTSTNKLVDLYMAYKFIRLLVTKWENLDAFTFGIIDKDDIEISNLSRQIIFSTNDLKKNKSFTSFILFF